MRSGSLGPDNRLCDETEFKSTGENLKLKLNSFATESMRGVFLLQVHYLGIGR